MNDTKIKKQIVDKIKDSTNVLVALSSNPSVDELSAALGVTLAINKIDKHATAVFSGDIPAAIEFLEPEKTFENNVSSLQDFIIALDKEKADHLRYKVMDDMVKIFITPYRTTIDEKDLEFSQGDFNVDFVLAIGGRSADDLDAALASHGQILQDATVASISLDQASELGSINWNDKNASSYCEMATGIAKDLKEDILDEQISTALLTGIVAATDRFSNNKTSSRVMTLAADLMAAGANQQLIAVQLQKADAITSPAAQDAAEPKDVPADAPAQPAAKTGGAGELSINHEYTGDVDQVAAQVAEAGQADAAVEAQAELAKQLQGAPAQVAPSPIGAAKALDYEETPVAGATIQANAAATMAEPALGGTLNATAEEAAADKIREAENDKNRTILSHDSGHYLGGEPSYQAPISASVDTAQAEPEVRDIFADNGPAPTGKAPTIEPTLAYAQPAPEPVSTLPPLPTFQPAAAAATVPTLAEIDAANRAQAASALTDVHAAFGGAPAPATPVAGTELPPLPTLPPLPDFSTLPPMPTGEDPALLGQSTIPEQPLGSTLPPSMAEPGKADPGQFQIPPMA